MAFALSIIVHVSAVHPSPPPPLAQTMRPISFAADGTEGSSEFNLPKGFYVATLVSYREVATITYLFSVPSKSFTCVAV